MIEHYILVNGKIKLVPVLEWAMWFDNIDNRRIDYTDISDEPEYPGGKLISTVFLGLDHNFDEREDWKEHLPLLFETMVFGGKYDQRGWRWSSYGEAKRGHWAIVDRIRAGNPPDANFGERPAIEEFFEMFDEEQEED